MTQFHGSLDHLRAAIGACDLEVNGLKMRRITFIASTPKRERS
jgi:hypothetical protein